MLGVSGLLGNSGDGAAAGGAPEGGGGSRGGGGGGGGEEAAAAVGSNSGGFSEEERGRGGGGGGGEEGDRSSAGNRWPREETLALLKIRSDMDAAFRDSSLKGPLWDEVSRKLAELGYQRSSKKCKEKFENVYKYHKRTKEGRASKADGKTYRFFDQLEALDSHYASLHSLPPPPQQQLPPPPPKPQSTAAPLTTTQPVIPQITVPSAATNNPTTNAPTMSINPSNPLPLPQPQPQQPGMNPSHHHHPVVHSARGSIPNVPVNFTSSNSTSYSSSSTSSDETLEEGGNGRRKRKRKWKEFFERIMRGVIEKQEELQRKFLEAIEKRERDRMVREEAWRMQEMTRINREHEILVQERSIAAAKDAALISFLQKMSPSDEPNPAQVPSVQEINPLQVSVISQVQPPPPPAQQQQQQQPQPTVVPQPTVSPIPAMNNLESGNNKMMIFDGAAGTSTPSTSSSRWPKTEVEALIKLRTELDVKYQESGPKGPLWEEISGGMRGLGYSRSAKRCKEKWENINKYFKKVKESNKKRPEDSKTCPYFHQLDALYREKNRIDGTSTTPPPPPPPPSVVNLNPNYGLKPPENNPMVPLMVRPEQQWPPVQIPVEAPTQQPDSAAAGEDTGSENMGHNLDDDDDDDDDDGDEEEDEGSGYEIVTNKQGTSIATAGGE